MDTESKKFYFRTGSILKATGYILGMKNFSFQIKSVALNDVRVQQCFEGLIGI